MGNAPMPSQQDLTAVMFSSLSAADLAQLARCAWQRQQQTSDPERGHREFATLALWNAVGCRCDAGLPVSGWARA